MDDSTYGYKFNGTPAFDSIDLYLEHLAYCSSCKIYKKAVASRYKNRWLKDLERDYKLHTGYALKKKHGKYSNYLRRSLHKMRYLDFTSTTNAKELYDMLYDGLCAEPRGNTGEAANRIMSMIFDKLESIGILTKRNNIDTFTLNDTSILYKCVALEEAEYNRILDALNAVPWSNQAARKVVALFNWIKSATRTDPSTSLSKEE